MLLTRFCVLSMESLDWAPCFTRPAREATHLVTVVGQQSCSQSHHTASQLQNIARKHHRARRLTAQRRLGLGLIVFEGS